MSGTGEYLLAGEENVGMCVDEDGRTEKWIELWKGKEGVVD